MTEPCQHCGIRPATLIWTGEDGTLAFIHGMSERWCDYCVTEAQLAYARAQAARIPALVEKFKHLGGLGAAREEPVK